MNSPFALLSLIIAIPLFGVLFALAAKDNDKTNGRNVYNVCMFTLIANIVLIWRVFMVLDTNNSSLQLVENFDWLAVPKISLSFGVDTFSALMILAVHIAILIGLAGGRNNIKQAKAQVVFSLLFLSMTTGFFVAADIFSFYMFFEAMLVPLFMLIGIFGEVKKNGVLQRFFLYNFLGALLFFGVLMLIYADYGALPLNEVKLIPLKSNLQYYIWGGIFLSLLSRIPIWPFHYWISSVNSSIRSPLVFIMANILPLTGIYGFVRFLPAKLPLIMSYGILGLEIIGVVTMLFIALIGFINKDAQYKLFSYITVYYIMYLLGVFTTNELILLNIGFALFSYLIIFSALELLSMHLYHQQERLGVNTTGMLCFVPRLSFVYSYLSLAAIGLPLSAIFLNNFLILSRLLSDNIKMGMLLMFALVLVGGTLLQELYKLKDPGRECSYDKVPADISKKMFAFMCLVIFILLMSFVKPLWFVVGEM